MRFHHTPKITAATPTHLTPTDFETLTTWLAQYDPNDLPLELQFTRTPIQTRIDRIVVLLANLVCEFNKSNQDGAFATFTKREFDQFVKLQRYHHQQRFYALTRQGHDAATAAGMMGYSLFQGTIEAITPYQISPHMLIHNEAERSKIKAVFENVLLENAKKEEMELLRKAEEAAMELLREVDAENTCKNQKKKKKKLQPKKQQKAKPTKKNDVDNKQKASDEKDIGTHNADDVTVQVLSAPKEPVVEEEAAAEGSDITKRVKFHEQLTKKATEGNRGENADVEVKGILKVKNQEEISDDVVAHLMVPLKIDYNDRVSDTALPQPTPAITAETICESIVPPMSPKKLHADSDFAALVSEIESLKSENAHLRREVATISQNLTEAVQRVQLKAYVAETARDSAQERAAMLESLLIEVVEGKIAGIELQEVLLGFKQQATSPTAGSSLGSLLDRLPKDTWIHVNSNPNQQLSPLREELHNHKGFLSQLRQSDT
jgi:hypothetical protein